MELPQPHYFLFCNTQSNASRDAGQSHRPAFGRWHFVLEQLDGAERLEAADSERAVNDERLALLSVVRGLEALEQPSKVTLVTTSRYVSRGLRYGLETWREADYQWERFGERKPIRNADLWRRVDGALQFHGVTCRLLESERSRPPQFEAATDSLATQVSAAPSAVAEVAEPQAAAAAVATVAAPAEGSIERLERIHAAETRLMQLESRLASWQTAELANQSRPAAVESKPAHRDFWWRLAAFWLKWWRGRFQPNHALVGT